MTETYDAQVPAQPDGLRVVTDRDGDVWQKLREGYDTKWVCTKPKVMALLGNLHHTSWRMLVINFGPLTALQWEQQSAPDLAVH